MTTIETILAVFLFFSLVGNTFLFFAYRRFKQETLIDPLTGLANRRAFDTVLWHEIERTRRDDVPITVFLIDLNGFKKVNDEHGHAAGDDLLCRFANGLRTAFPRKVDVVSRWGGDEFAVILHNLPKDRIAIVLERLFAVLAQVDGASASFGIITEVGRRGTLSTEEQVRKVIGQVDGALYVAKREKETVRFPYVICE